MGVLAATERTERAPLAPERYDWLHRQAELQVQSRDSGRAVHRHLEPKRAVGYALLPQPRSGGWPHLDPREREMLGQRIGLVRWVDVANHWPGLRALPELSDL